MRLVDLDDGSERQWLTDGHNFGVYVDAVPALLAACRKGYCTLNDINNAINNNDPQAFEELVARSGGFADACIDCHAAGVSAIGADKV